ncbi:hypothetical protein Plhal703r1_c19g0085511 [Plasmopara halstedii]
MSGLTLFQNGRRQSPPINRQKSVFELRVRMNKTPCHSCGLSKTISSYGQVLNTSCRRRRRTRSMVSKLGIMACI